VAESAQVLVVGIDHDLQLVVKLVWVLDRAGSLLHKVDDHALGPADQLDQVVRDESPYVHGRWSGIRDAVGQGCCASRETERCSHVWMRGRILPSVRHCSIQLLDLIDRKAMILMNTSCNI